MIVLLVYFYIPRPKILSKLLNTSWCWGETKISDLALCLDFPSWSRMGLRVEETDKTEASLQLCCDLIVASGTFFSGPHSHQMNTHLQGPSYSHCSCTHLLSACSTCWFSLRLCFYITHTPPLPSVCVTMHVSVCFYGTFHFQHYRRGFIPSSSAFVPLKGRDSSLLSKAPKTEAARLSLIPVLLCSAAHSVMGNRNKK